MTLAQECISELTPLIAHNTVNPGGDELALCDRLETRLRELGADTISRGELERPSGVSGYVYARFGTPTLLWNSHVDTVPPNRGWTRDPFTLTCEGDRVYGLGTCDTKGAAAAMLTAIKHKRPKNLAILFSGDEEHGSRCVPYLLQKEDFSGIEAAIVCEPTARRAGVAHRGMLAYRAKTAGVGGHSSKADFLDKLMVNLGRLAIFLNECAEAAMGEGPEGMKGLCMNVASIAGGVAYNVVPENAELEFSLRPAAGFDDKDFEEKVRAFAGALTPPVELERIVTHSPFACGDHKKITDLVGDFCDDFGILDFWTEAPLLEEAGIPSVVLGPGDIAQAHAADEFVTEKDLEWATQMFLTLIERHAL